MVVHPGAYCWSTCRANAQAEMSALIQLYPLYLTRVFAKAERRQAYRELFRVHLEPGLVERVRTATNGKYVL